MKTRFAAGALALAAFAVGAAFGAELQRASDTEALPPTAMCHDRVLTPRNGQTMQCPHAAHALDRTDYGALVCRCLPPPMRYGMDL